MIFMYEYHKEIEEKKIINVGEDKIVVYPRYITTDSSIYYDKGIDHESCMINTFIMNLINGILEKEVIEEIDKYLVDFDLPDNQVFTSLERYIYNGMKEIFDAANNPREAAISLLKQLKYIVPGENIIKITGARKMTDLMVTLFLNDKIYPLDIKKSITTSKINIYETFYNYLIMEYKINKCPKLVFDGNSFYMDWSTCYHMSDKEERLRREIKTIKKTPYDERHKYLI